MLRKVLQNEKGGGTILKRQSGVSRCGKSQPAYEKQACSGQGGNVRRGGEYESE